MSIQISLDFRVKRFVGLAGEKLTYDLKRMEMAYYEQNKRGYELTKNISLVQLTPEAIVALRKDGTCFIDIPEALFDMDYPGHYMRRIKSVSLSIPCIAGPYTTIACTLTMVSNKYRKDTAADPYEETADESGYDPRFKYESAAIQSIATSTGQRDSGLFQLNFEDERYNPFEGAGAISSWKIELPNKIRQFDYNSISDVIMHMSFTAKDGGETLKDKAGTALVEIIEATVENNTMPLYKLFSLKHDFPGDFYLMQNTDSGSYPLKIGSSWFPYFTRNLTIAKAKNPTLYQVNGSTVTDASLINVNASYDDSSKEWTLEFTFKKEDLPDDVLVLLNYTLSGP